MHISTATQAAFPYTSPRQLLVSIIAPYSNGAISHYTKREMREGRETLGQLRLGVIAGVHTQLAALAFAVEQTGNEQPNLGYSTVFPLATIAKIVLAQLLLALLR